MKLGSTALPKDDTRNLNDETFFLAYACFYFLQQFPKSVLLET